MNEKKLGREGEDLAAAYLRKKGLKIRLRNWRHRYDEVDLIAEDVSHLVFVEVKTRSSAEYGAPETFVSNKKQRYLIRAANAYVELFQIDAEIRFDVLGIILAREPIIEHIEEAFYP